MAIFAGLSDIVLFFILFVLIYVCNDSIIAQITLFGFTVYSLVIFIPTMDGTQISAQFALFLGVLIVFTLGNILMWIHDYTEAKKMKEARG